MRPPDALAWLRRHAPAGAGRMEEDDFGDARFVVRVPRITHLDADALNDRLAAFVAREVAERLPGASAGVSFHHAHPETDDAPDLDEEAVWRDVDAIFRLDLHSPPATESDLARFLAWLPRFLDLVKAQGRPEGWRPDPNEGSTE